MADPIWLQKLKRALSGGSTPLGAPVRPNFSGTAGYNQPATISPDYNNVLGLARRGALVDPHLAAAAGGPGWGSGMAPSTMTKVPASGKKGLSVENMIRAMSELKAPTGKDFDRMAGVVGRNPKVQFDPMVVLNPNYDYSFGGLNFDPLKRQRKIYGSLV